MPRPRHPSLRRKRRPRLADAKLQARVNPDALARNLLSWRKHLTSDQQRREVWSLLQNLGGDAVVQRAIQTIRGSRRAEELEGVLRAAAADGWYEVVPSLTLRFHREALRAARGDQLAAPHLVALAQAAWRLGAKLNAADIRVLLKSKSPRLRTAGAELVARQNHHELLDDCLPLCWETGEAHVYACDALGRMGTAAHAAALWPRVLAARKHGHERTFKRLLAVLGQMGVFDIQLAVRVWIEEDFQKPSSGAWEYGRLWSELAAAKLASGATRDEALHDLRWFLKTAGPDLDENFNGLAAEQGFFAVARQFVLFGEKHEAEAMIRRYEPHAMPSLRLFPELCLPALSHLTQYATPFERQLWLAALYESSALHDVSETWLHQLRTGQRPLNFEVSRHLDEKTVQEALRRALADDAPGVVRQTLCLLAELSLVQQMRGDITALTHHPSNVVRWKARRVLQRRAHAASEAMPPRHMRLDAAVLSGAVRRNISRRTRKARQNNVPVGIVLSERQGHGYLLKLDGLTPAGRRATIDALLKGPLSRALERRVPQGPALEERPDIRAIHELAPPGNAIDERMVEMAQAMMSYWNDGDDTLTLDEEGVGLIATGLTADVHALDEDDVMACGAFVGEVLRKRLGGHWTGFDDNYVLEIGDTIIDPLKWARDAHATKDIVEATRTLTAQYREALERLEVHRARVRHADPTAAIERTLHGLLDSPAARPMTELLAETRVLSYRLELNDWPGILASITTILDDPAGVRAAAALAVYAPAEAFAPAWAQWGRRRREETGFVDTLAEAMHAAAERDDLEAMPNWTAQPQQSRLCFLNSLRKRMDTEAWKKVLLLLLRQRAAAGDRNGVSWCLYSYKYEFPDCLELVERFCDMSVSARQTVLKATQHCTRAERTVFRCLWAEALRDPSLPVVAYAVNAVSLHNAKSLRPLIEALVKDPREQLAELAVELLKAWI